jgi:hypothetical protein
VLGVSHAGGHDGQAMLAVPPEHGHQVLDRCRVAHGHGAPHALALAPPPVQSLAQGVPRGDVERGRTRQGHHHVPAREIELRRVREDGHTRRQADGRVEDLAELVGAGSDEPGVVASRHRDRAQPQEWQGHRDEKVLGRDHALGIEADYEC